MRRAVDELGQTIVMVTHDPVAAGVRRPRRVPRRRPHRRRDARARPPSAVLDRMKQLRGLSRHVHAHAARACSPTSCASLLTALAVMLGVAFLAGTLVLTDTIGADVRRPVRRRLRGHRRRRARRGRVRGTDQTRRTSGPRSTRRSSTRSRGVDGVASAEGSVVRLRPARRQGRRGRSAIPATGAPTLGGNWIDVAAAQPVRRSSRAARPAADDEVVIDQQSARDGRLRRRRHGHGARSRAAPQRVHDRRHRHVRRRRQPRRRHARRCSRRRAAQRLAGRARQGRQRSRVVADAGVSQDELADRIASVAAAPASRRSPAQAITEETQDEHRQGACRSSTRSC